MSAMFELARPDESTRQASSLLEQTVEQVLHSAEQHSVTLVVQTSDGNQAVEVPRAMLDALLCAAREQAEGHRVRITAPDSTEEMTPNEAAAYLGISRPLLIKLVENGTIPARRLPGSSHRKIAVASLDAYNERKARRLKRLSEVMNDAAEDGLYFPER